MENVTGKVIWSCCPPEGEVRHNGLDAIRVLLRRSMGNKRQRLLRSSILQNLASKFCGPVVKPELLELCRVMHEGA
eukprot:4739756-Prorocentrum_lima.AAC.1